MSESSREGRFVLVDVHARICIPRAQNFFVSQSLSCWDS
jgi:hypothetical protein